MAKLTALQCTNIVLDRIGEAELSVLTSLTTIQQVAFDNLNRSIEKIFQDINITTIETSGTITLATNTGAYAFPTGYRSCDKESFRSADANRNVRYLTVQEFDAKFPDGVTGTRVGYPQYICESFGQFVIDRYPTTAENGKIINYRYFKIPTLFSTASPTGNCEIPEGYDRTLLCDYATWLTMSYMGHSETQMYWALVFGEPGDRKPEGELTQFKRKFSQPPMKARFTAIL